MADSKPNGRRVPSAEGVACGGDRRNVQATELPGKSRNISVGFRERVGRGAAAALARSLGRKFAVKSPAACGAFQRIAVERGLEIDLHGFTVAAGALLGP